MLTATFFWDGGLKDHRNARPSRGQEESVRSLRMDTLAKQRDPIRAARFALLLDTFTGSFYWILFWRCYTASRSPSHLSIRMGFPSGIIFEIDSRVYPIFHRCLFHPTPPHPTPPHPTPPHPAPPHPTPPHPTPPHPTPPHPTPPHPTPSEWLRETDSGHPPASGVQAMTCPCGWDAVGKRILTLGRSQPHTQDSDVCLC